MTLLAGPERPPANLQATSGTIRLICTTSHCLVDRLTQNLEQSPAAAEDAVSIANCHRLLRAYHRAEYMVA